MRVSVLVYVLLYLVVELVGAQLAAVDWASVTPLMVASAVTSAMLVVSVLVAVLVAADLTKHRWRPALEAWRENARLRAGWWGTRRHADSDAEDDYAEVVGVTSWRVEQPALPMGSPAAPRTATYAPPTYAVPGAPTPKARPFPEDDGTLL